ncbi:MAG: hypothetical protein HYV60_05745 [Planctomycetia bacterium]|nr:hypothetical protein [Planctomycetia bacterium]
MSTAAHEPRRVGPRRVESPSASKVTPRRNAPDTNELDGPQYDSDELPVLIRLPNLRDIGSVETRTASPSTKKGHRTDRSSASTQRTSKSEASKVSKKSIQQYAGNNKLVLGGIVGGIFVVVMLFVFNASRPAAPVDQDGWANQGGELHVEEPDLSHSAAKNPPPLLPPDFTYTAPAAKNAQFASGELEKAPLDTPYDNTPLVPSENAAFASPSKQPSVTEWPSEETMGALTPAAPTDLWPGESLSDEPGGYQHPLTDSTNQTDDRSSMYPSDADTYRMGKLDSDRPQTFEGDRSSILNGNIAIPDTKSQR